MIQNGEAGGNTKNAARKKARKRDHLTNLRSSHSTAIGARTNRGTKALIRNINQRVTIDDTLYHIGDFCCRGNERGVPGGRMKARELEREIECRIVHILGNHDRNNGVESGLDSANMTFGGNIKFHLVHRPPTSPYQVPDGTDCVLCGHVHEKWHTQWLGNILQINVGVDVNKFIPLTKNEIVGIYQKETRERTKLREVSE